MRVTVKNTELKHKSGVGKMSGKPYSFYEQKAWGHFPDKPFPIEFSMTVNEGESAYAPGEYLLEFVPSYVDKFGSIKTNNKLVLAGK